MISNVRIVAIALAALALGGVWYSFAGKRPAPTARFEVRTSTKEIPLRVSSEASRPNSALAPAPSDSAPDSPASPVESASINPVKIEGQVEDMTSGRPLREFRLLAKRAGNPDGPSNHKFRRVLDAQGRFALTDAEQDAREIIFRANGYADTVVPLPPPRPGETQRNVLVRMEVGAELDGQVVDNSGRPIEGAEVRIEGDDANDWGPGDGRSDVSNDDGSFALQRLPSGAVKLLVSESRFVTKTVSINVSRHRENSLTVTLDPKVGAVIEGLVTLNGERVAGQEVYLFSPSDPGKAKSRVTTDLQGHYRLEGAPEGRVKVVAAILLPGGAGTSKQAEFEVKEGAAIRQDFDFKSGTAEIAGRVILPPGLTPGPPIVATVVFNRDGNEHQTMNLDLDPNGAFKAGHLPAGDIQLQIYNVGKGTKSVGFTLKEGEHARHDVRFAGGATIHAKVSWSGNDALFGVVYILRGTVEITELSQDFWDSVWGMWAGRASVENGKLAEVSSLEAGTYTVIAAVWTRPAGRAPSVNTGWKAQVVNVADDQELSLAMSL